MRMHNVLLAACAAAAMMAAAMTSSADEAPWRFAVISDTQGQPTTGSPGVGPYLSTIAKAIAAENPPVDFVLVSGDLISGGIGKHENGQPPIAQMFQTWLTDMAPVYDAGIKVYPVRGNHETITKPFGLPENDKQPFLDAFAKFRIDTPGGYIPDNGPDDAQWLIYSFQHKNSLIMGLDFYINGVGDKQSIPQSWIDQQFKDNKLPHVFVYAHPPIVQAFATPLGVDSIMPTVDTFYDSLVNAGCKVYFCGHDHFHNRATLSRNGKLLCQYINGTGGGRHYPWYQEGFSTSANCSQCDISAQLANYFEYSFGYTVVTVSDDKRFSTVWKVLENGLNEPIIWTDLDPFDYSYDKYATYGMESSLSISAMGSPSAASGYKVTATGSYADPVKGNTKALKKETLKSGTVPTTFDYQWLDKITMWNKKLWEPAKTAAENLAAYPINPVECDMSVTVNGASSSETVAYYPAIITAAVDIEGNQIYSVATGQQFTLYGWYFGTKAPTVYLEYEKNGKVVALNLKMDKSSYAFPDAKGNPGKSCMDVTTGNSMLVLTVPKAWPKDWDTSAPHNIVVDNGVARATMPFCIASPDPD